MSFSTRPNKKGDDPPPSQEAGPLADARPVPSFAEIFQQHGAFLWRALWGLGVPASDIEDLCQEVFMVVHRRLAGFDGRSRSWLYAIAVRVASEHRRRAHIRREVVTEAAAADLATAASQGDEIDHRRMRQCLLHVLDSLDEDKRVAFVLFEIEQLTLREIAESLGCPLQTVYSRVQSAKRHVNQAFTMPIQVERKGQSFG